MPGMNSGLNPANPILVAAFRTALVRQWAIVALIFALLLVAWGMVRAWVTGRGKTFLAAPAVWHEPRARRLPRVWFGALWLFDGILQAQPQMARGLPSQWRLAGAATVWSNIQKIGVPIQCGSSS